MERYQVDKNSYAGSKHGSGSFQQIINEIPPIKRLYIPFLGNCPLARWAAGKVEVVVNDIDRGVIESYWSGKNFAAGVDYNVYASGEFLENCIFPANEESFIYCDPPYPEIVRKSGRKLYKFEMMDEQSHIELLQQLKSLPGYVAISSYKNDLYDLYLDGWRVKEWRVATRQGSAIECLYMNYSKPKNLLTYDFLGDNNTDRQRIKRKINRWVSKLSTLDLLEQAAIMDRLNCLQDPVRK